MVVLIIISLLTCIFAGAENAPSIYQRHDINQTRGNLNKITKNTSYIGASGADSEQYFESLAKVLSVFEEDHSLKINPTAYPKIAIKVETGFAPGLQTSKFLLEGVIKFLERRGYGKENVIIFDKDKDGLERAGFLPDDEAEIYQGHRVFHSMNENYFMQGWFHDSPLPPSSFDRAKLILKFPSDPQYRFLEERKSYLPAMLFKDSYWINLAVPMDDVFLGVDGAASNISLGAINNNARFLQKKTMAPATVAEILAIPEIWEKRIFSILDFSNYQIANGQRFDSKYTEKNTCFFLSKNPFALDYLAWKLISQKRVERKLRKRVLNDSLLFRYAEELGLGSPQKTIVKNMSHQNL